MRIDVTSIDTNIPSPIDPAVLALLRCPRTGQPLRAGIREGRAVLTTDDGRAVYAIVGGIPNLLPDQTEARAQARAPDAH